jgi:hypothetical protein
LVIKATADHIRRIAGDSNPIQAIIELIWNSIDAEASHVAVSYSRSPLGAITEVSVVDVGHGISEGDVVSAFGRIGDSWKAKGNRRSKNDIRPVHGSKGQGRLRAFALGNQIQWISTSINPAGEKRTVTIEGSASSRDVFTWESNAAADNADIGTYFRAFDSQRPSLLNLEKPTSRDLIASAFAPTLLDDASIEIVVDQDALNPRDQISDDTSYDEVVRLEDQSEINVKVRIIEWKNGDHRQIYFGESPGRASYVEDGRQVESRRRYSAYISWPDLESGSGIIGLGSMAPDPVGRLIHAAYGIIRKHFRERDRQYRREQLDVWKSLGIYPYKGEATDEAERVERALVAASWLLVISRCVGAVYWKFDWPISGFHRQTLAWKLDSFSISKFEEERTFISGELQT